MNQELAKLQAEVIRRMEAHQGETFTQKRGKTFTYEIEGRKLLLHTGKTYPMGVAAIEKAVERMPVEGPGQINDLRAPAYLYGILMDERIRKGLY